MDKIDANFYSTEDEAIKEEMPCVKDDNYYITTVGIWID